MRRIRVTLAYDGTEFHGWQVQPGLPTIQGALEQAVSEIDGGPVAVLGSGRTDAGVHALAQVAAFSLGNPIPLDNLRRALNRLLPPAIRILTAEEAAADFHPRYQAHSKTYEYRIFRGEICPPFERLYVHHYPYPLDAARIVELAPLLEGEHDFSAFAASDEKDSLGGSKVRTIFSSRALRPERPPLLPGQRERFPETHGSQPGGDPAGSGEGEPRRGGDRGVPYAPARTCAPAPRCPRAVCFSWKFSTRPPPCSGGWTGPGPSPRPRR